LQLMFTGSFCWSEVSLTVFVPSNFSSSFKFRIIGESSLRSRTEYMWETIQLVSLS
jgi:hypothetical protein